MTVETQELGAGLIDLGGIPLDELWDLGDDENDTVLQHVLRRVTDTGSEENSVSAFNSAI